MVHKRSRGRNSPQQPGPKRRRIDPAPKTTTILRLKIQRMRGDDFFISISQTDMITKLKQQVLRVLRSTPGPEVCVEITNIRLIYKGKVLADEKSIEFYRMQNEDTIQLVPFRSSRSASQGERESQRRRRPNREDNPALNEASAHDPITVFTFTSSLMGEPSRAENRPSASLPNELRRAFNNQIHRQRERSSTTRRPRPVTSLSLRNYKDILQRTHLRVHLAQQQRRRGVRETEQRALLSQLQILTRQSLSLRDDLIAEIQSQSNDERPREMFQSTSENGVFSIVPRQQNTPERSRSVRLPSTDDEKTHSPVEEKKTEDDPSRSTTATSPPHSDAESPSSFFHRNNALDIVQNHSRSQSNIHVRQNSQSPRFQRFLHVSRVDSPATSGSQRDDPLRSFLSSVLINASVSLQSNGQGAANAIAGSVGQSRDQQHQTRSLSPSRAPSTAPAARTQPISEQTSEQASTAGSRLRNIFYQFINRFIN